MQSCPKCKITIRGHKACCPLCQGKLQGEPEGEPFVVLTKPKVSNLTFFRIAAFVSVFIELLMGFLRYLVGPSAVITMIAIITIVALADLYIMSWFRNNIMKTMVVQIYILMLLTVISDYNTGGIGWAAAWVLPIAFVAMAIGTMVVGVLYHLPLESYVMYLFWNVVLSLLQIIFIAAGRNPFPVPAILSMLLLVLLGAAVVIFRQKDLKSAAEKWFSL